MERYEGTWRSHNMQICIYVKCVCKQLKMLRVSLLCNFHFHHPIIWLIWIGFFLEGNFELICNFANDTHFTLLCKLHILLGQGKPWNWNKRGPSRWCGGGQSYLSLFLRSKSNKSLFFVLLQKLWQVSFFIFRIMYNSICQSVCECKKENCKLVLSRRKQWYVSNGTLKKPFFLGRFYVGKSNHDEKCLVYF